MFDIGSNSVRFVAYDGPPRAPMPIYNEKWPISLGRIVRDQGRIDDASMAHLITGIDRFMSLAAMMEISDIRAVATAAIRDSENGQDFLDAAAKMGLEIELLDGKKEAQAAAHGVLCNYPDADGYVADMGGGSMEIARVENGQISGMISLSLGTSKLMVLDDAGWADARSDIETAITENGSGPVAGKSLYLVGGAWRALAHLHQHISGHPISILSHYEMLPDELSYFTDERMKQEYLTEISVIPSQRYAQLPHAARMLTLLNKIFTPSQFMSSALGIREGLLFGQLSESERQKDPLLCCARYSGQRLGRSHFDGDALFKWMQPLFADNPAGGAGDDSGGHDNDGRDDEGEERLRHATCLLADCAWNIHPDYRSAHALQIGIEGHWLGVDSAGRALIARALWSAYGDSKNDGALLSQLARRQDLLRADKWGLAIRLGMRIDGGTGAILGQCPIAVDGDKLSLSLPAGMSGTTIGNRLQKLASGMGLSAEII